MAADKKEYERWIAAHGDGGMRDYSARMAEQLQHERTAPPAKSAYKPKEISDEMVTLANALGYAVQLTKIQHHIANPFNDPGSKQKLIADEIQNLQAKIDLDKQLTKAALENLDQFDKLLRKLR